MPGNVVQSGSEATVEIDVQLRKASFAPNSYDEKSRTVELLWSTGAQVRRYDWLRYEEYIEELSLDPKNIRMDRLNSGAPLLNTHRRYGLDDVLGVVEKAWVGEDGARSLVKFSQRADVEPIVKDVRDNIIRNVSVGYVVHKYERIKAEKEGGLDTLRAVDWEPMEISLVPIGADKGAGVRSEESAVKYSCTIQNRAAPEEVKMDEELKPGGKPGSADTVAPTEVEKARSEEVTNAERRRALEITNSVRSLNLPTEVADELIRSGTALEDARKIIIDKAAAVQSAVRTDAGGVRITAGQLDERQTRREAIETALMHRADSKVVLTDAAREWTGMSLMEMAREVLVAEGVKIRGLGRSEIASRSLLGTSDFPYILTNVGNKSLRAAYEAAPQTFRPLVREVSATDFKTMSRNQLGDAPNLEKVNASGEFKRGSIPEAREQYALATYGKIIGLTRQTIINDDLSAFTRIPMLMGRAAADLESDTVWGIITANAVMGDGIALFEANTHKNLTGTGTVISIDSLGIGRTAMRMQKGLSALRFLNLMAKYLIVPAAKETIAQQYTTQTNVIYTKGADVNPFSTTLQVIAEPRLDANSLVSWYLAADPSQIDMIELAYLAGQRGVFMETRTGFDVDGVEMKVRLDVAAKAIDFRGLYKNNGA